MGSIETISCKKCNKSYLVGVEGRDIRNAQKSTGDFQNTPFMAIGNDEISL